MPKQKRARRDYLLDWLRLVVPTRYHSMTPGEKLDWLVKLVLIQAAHMTEDQIQLWIEGMIQECVEG